MKSESPYRVLHVVFRSQRGGAELVAIQLAANMSEKYENEICSLFRPNKLKITIDIKYKLEVSPNWMTRMTGISLKAVLGLRKIIKQFKPHIIVAHQDEAYKHTALAKLLCGTGSKYVYQFTNYPLLIGHFRLRKYINRLFINMFDVVVCCGETCRQGFLKYYGVSSKKVTSIDTAIDQAAFKEVDVNKAREEIRTSLGIGPQSIVLVNVARLETVKNQTELISLVASLHKLELCVFLLIVGNGDLKETLNQQIEKLGLQEYIKLLGERDDIPSVLAATDLFVMTSRTEAMPLVLMEAGMRHIPAVAYNVGGIQDVIEDGTSGKLTSFGNLQELTRVVAELCTDSKRRLQMGEEAYKRSREKFDIQKTVVQYEKLFCNLLNEPPK